MFLETANALAPTAPVVPTQISAAMACGYVLWLLQKAKSVPWITQYTAKLNALVRLAVSAVASVGIGIKWEGTAHTLTISNLTAVVVMTGLWHWFTQYAATHGFEKILSVIPSSTSLTGDSAGKVPIAVVDAPAGTP